MVHLMKQAVLSGECSIDLFFACKQAYLVVLTVNVLVILLLRCFETPFCLYSVSKAPHPLHTHTHTHTRLAEPLTKLAQTLIDSVLFLNQMSIVSDECIYFWACPHLFKEFAQSVGLRWRQDPLFFLFFSF